MKFRLIALTTIGLAALIAAPAIAQDATTLAPPVTMQPIPNPPEAPKPAHAKKKHHAKKAAKKTEAPAPAK